MGGVGAAKECRKENQSSVHTLEEREIVPDKFSEKCLMDPSVSIHRPRVTVRSEIETGEPQREV